VCVRSNVRTASLLARAQFCKARRREEGGLSPNAQFFRQRILIASKAGAPLDDNTSLVLKGDVLCTANLGFTHAKPEEADRTVVCMKGFPVPK